MIRPGEPWGEPTSSPPDLEVRGGDAALAAAAASAPGALVRFLPGRDQRPRPSRRPARRTGEPRPTALRRRVPVDDALDLDDGSLACNMCVIGAAPDRLRWSSSSVEIEVLLDGKPWFSGPATTVVIANGQFLRGNDLVPRGHPGDGKAEIQVYELRRRERRSMRRRLPTGAHLPHPRIRSRTAGQVEVRGSGLLALEVDGEARPPVSGLRIRVVPPAFRLLL